MCNINSIVVDGGGVGGGGRGVAYWSVPPTGRKSDGGHPSEVRLGQKDRNMERTNG